jgi:hypothetical protein
MTGTVFGVVTVAKRSFTIEKLQEIEGSKAGFMKSLLTGLVGQTVDYKIIVKNTGNVSLKFGKLTDANCTAISPSGEETVAAGGEETYTCHHKLTTTGFYTNEASIEGSEGTGSKTSNEVEVEVDQAPAFVMDTPPLEATAGTPYGYPFVAEGVPAPTYALAAGHPSWLSVSNAVGTEGLVTGTPPAGTKEFTYSVTAANTIGKATAGPFKVKVAPASVKADISAALSCTPTSIKMSASSVCTLTVANAGPATASKVVAAIVLPAALSEVSCSNSCATHHNVFTWALASLAAKASQKYTVTVKALRPGSARVLGAAASQSHDPNWLNNVSLQTITIAH